MGVKDHCHPFFYNFITLSESGHTMKNRFFACCFFCCMLSSVYAQQALKISSPDQNLQVEVVLKEKIYYTVTYKNERVLELSPISLTLKQATLGVNPELAKVDKSTIDQNIETVWGSRATIRDHYQEMTLDFKKDFLVQFRAYNQGVAYRLITRLNDDEITVMNEEVAFRFKFGTNAWLLDGQSYETNFIPTSLDVEEISNFNNEVDKIYLPAVVEPAQNVKMLITEAGLHNYPSLFLQRGNDYENYLLGTFEKYALSSKTGGFSNYSQLADQEADYIAKTVGSNTFPWRLMVISDDDRTFADCDLVYQLSEPSRLVDTDWIKPGKVAWEWWHDYVVEGENFRGGVNTETYLYHVDFAAKYGLEYIMIDWMWTDKYDLTLINPDLDFQKIVDYASEKEVGVILWCPGHTLHRQLEKALDLFKSYGAAGVKVDFFGREDQTGIRMYEDIAKAAARREMLVDFHGCAKPTGLSRTYPNIINYEAVAGNEYNKLSVDRITADHKVMLPFTRGLQGPMDFTPGGMRNVQSGHILRFTLPMVHGTRSNEAALFVIYNEPLKMMCDAPSVYDQEPEFTQFIAGIPTVWDETRVLDAEFGKYVVTARRSGDTWFVAGITGATPKELNLDLSFLDQGTYQLNMIKDGPNADRVGTDYLMEKETIDRNTEFTVSMTQGGGFVMRIEK